MSRYGSGDYHRDRRERSPARFGDRRPSYNEPPRAPRGRELRDAPPLGRTPRDFAPRDAPRDADIQRPRRNSRDGPLSAGSTYSDPPPFRGGFGRGRGRGDPDFRGGRGGRRFDDRDAYVRDRSPPRWAREDRSPPWRDERRFERRDDGRRNDPWPERERDRDFDRWRDGPSNPDGRAPSDSQLPSTQNAGIVNPERLALIEDSVPDMSVRRASTISVPPQASRGDGRREQSDLPPYVSARTDSISAKYPSRTSSPPAQPPPVPAFTLSFAPAAQPRVDTKLEATAKPGESSVTEPAEQPGTAAAKLVKTATGPTASAPIGPDAAAFAGNADGASDVATRLPTSRSWDNLSAVATQQSSSTKSTSPVLQGPTRTADFVAPTGPKSSRANPQTSMSPRLPFAELSHHSSQMRPRSPPTTAPSGPRAHAPSRSPDTTFTGAPTGPKVDRIPPAAPRDADRANALLRASERSSQVQNRIPPTAPRSQQGWNLWRRDTAPNIVAKREPPANSLRAADPNVPSIAHTRPQADTASHAAPSAKRAASPKGHSAQQSFFGQPAKDPDDELASDLADDSISSSDDDDDDDEIVDLALFEAKFKRRQRELEAKLVDLSDRQYRATTPLETIARLACITMADVERFKDRDIEMDGTETQPARLTRHNTTTLAPSSGSDEGVDLATPVDEEDTSVLIHTGDDDEEDLRRIFRPTPVEISLPYMTRGLRDNMISELDAGLIAASNKEVEDRLIVEFQKREHLIHVFEEGFEELYRRWRLECEDLDYDRERQEELERQRSLEPGPEPDPSPSTAIMPVLEGRRPHRWASEYEIEQVLKQSEETARIEQEKADREAKRVQADMEKEAELPDQLDPQDFVAQAFIDENRLRNPESLTVVFAYEPAIDDFTEEEQQIFVAAFKEEPKKWTEIASLLPGREPKDCIRHYYANKWDGRFRDNKHRRNKAGRRGRGGKAIRNRASAMADLAGSDDMPVPVSDSGRPKRAAAPTTFAEKETEAKAMLAGQSPAKRANVKQEGADAEKPAKRARKTAGEKIGRKPKGTQQLAQIAAAPIISPEGRPMQMVQPHEHLDRSRALEDASLLTAFHNSRAAVPIEQQTVFATSDKFAPRLYDDTDRLRVPVSSAASSSKPSPSSYWSVPEQGDFLKYIAHFGTDFAAIAAHMGTKTQTMIKNHYQRQIEGSHPGLQEVAISANAARQRGDNIGAPPTPTPITKRKYDSAATVTQRTIVPQGDPMDIDESATNARSSHNKHESPRQFSVRPQYPPTTVPTPQMSHVGPSTATQEHAGSLMSGSASARQYQSGRGGLFDSAPDTRPSITGAPSFYPPASVASGQPSHHRTSQDAHDPYIRGLLEEQQRAIRLQDQQSQEQEPVDPYYHRATMQQQRSPNVQHIHEREHRPNSPPAPYFSSRPAQTGAPRHMGDRATHLLDPLRFPPPHPQTIASPPKRDPVRPALPSAFASGPSNKAAPEAPKRMDLFSMLNNSEDPKPKRNSLDMTQAAGQARAGSPAQHTALTASPYSSIPKPRELYAPVNQYPPSRGSVGHMTAPSRSPAPPTPLKQESLPAPLSGKQDWQHRSGLHSMGSQQPLPLEREVRPYYSHRSSLLSQGEPGRHNPSSPPHTNLQHSRTSSIAEGQARSFSGQSSAPSSTMYASPAYSHSGSLSASTSQLHHTQVNNANAAIHQQRLGQEDSYLREQANRENERDQERDREWRRYQRDRDERERQRLDAERRHEHERHYSRANAAPSQPPLSSYSASYEPNSSRMTSLREQSNQEAAIAMQQQEERMRQGIIYGARDREPPQAAEDARRRHDDAFLPAARRTPLGGGYGPPGLPGTGRR